MRQKYMIFRDRTQKKLNIREYAIIDKDLKKAALPILHTESFTLLGEENYKSEIVVNSISKGMNALLSTLRTHNIFPIEPNATKIAESVMALYDSAEDDSVELLFDDLDLLSA